MHNRKPYGTLTVLAVILLGCLLADAIAPQDPSYMALQEANQAPGAAHWFGTDALGRDLFSMIWYGGRVSLLIGGLATLISTGIAAVYGCIAGMAKEWIGDGMMRFTDILMSVPQILLVVFLQGMLGTPTVLSVALVIGCSGWMGVAKMVRSEVRRIRTAEYVQAAHMMGGGFFYVLYTHLAPNFFPSILFMVVSNLGGAIAMEATLSYLGIGLPVRVVSWGSLMSLSQNAMLTGAWWMLLLPGLFLVVTLICVTELGEWKRTEQRRERLL